MDWSILGNIAGVITAIATIIGGVAWGFTIALKRVGLTGKWIGKREAFEETTTKTLDRILVTIAEIQKDIQGIFVRLGSVETRLDSVETRLDSVETRLDSVETRLDSVETRLGSVETRLGSVETGLGSVETRLGALESIGTINRESPLKLSDLGHAISEELDASAWVQETAERLKDQVTAPTPYKIQKFCFDFVAGPDFNGPESLITEMEASAYKHGVPLSVVSEVLGVELRDAMLEKLGFEPSQKRDPAPTGSD